MSKLEQLVEEVGASDFRPLTEERREDRKESSIWDYDSDADTTMTLDQAKRFSDIVENNVCSTRFEDDEEFFDTWNHVLDDWPEVEVHFAGCIDEWGYLDAVYLCYDEAPVDEFEEYCVVHFKDKVGLSEKGICPFCDDRIGIDASDFEQLGVDCLHRLNVEDENLWAAPDEFDFYEYPDLGKCLRMWWDD